MSKVTSIKEIVIEVLEEMDEYRIQKEDFTWQLNELSLVAVEIIRGNGSHYKMSCAVHAMNELLWAERTTEDGSWTDTHSRRLRGLEKRFNQIVRCSDWYLKAKQGNGKQVGRRFENVNQFKAILNGLEAGEYVGLSLS